MKFLKLMILTTILLALSFVVSAQSFENENYNWEENREKLELTEEESEEPIFILKDYNKYEYVYSEDASGGLYLYITLHKIVRVNSDDAVQSYNKVYIPMGGVYDIVNLNARTINSNGEVFEIDKSEIKEIEDEETGNVYKLFALEGVEKGSEIEYFYILKKKSGLERRLYYQSSIPKKNVHFELVSPENLVFEAKSYNGFPEVSDTTIDEKNYLKASVDYIPALEEEVYSMYESNKMRVDYKLAYNTAKDYARLYTWAQAGEYMYNNLHTLLGKSEKVLDKLIKSLKLEKLDDQEAQIKELENYLKSNMAIFDDASFTSIEQSFEDKYTSDFGITKIYVNIFKKLGIEYQPVLTSSRYEARFDPEFDSWQQLENYVIYFPEFDKFMAPAAINYRYGLIPYNWTNNSGLFVENISIGDVETGLAKIKFIDEIDYKKSKDNLDINFEFTENMDALKFDFKRSFTGYGAVGFIFSYSYMKEDEKDELAEGLVKSVIEDAEFESIEIKNGDINQSPIEYPFIVEADFTSPSLINKAGNKYLFKIGESIGPQMEMYQDKNRKMDVENDFNRVYDRVLTFEIPEGYTVKNLEDLNIDIFFEKEGERIFNFTSSYTLKNNVVEVKVYEYYKQLQVPKSNYEDFRKVINAAADFNKIVLVLEEEA